MVEVRLQLKEDEAEFSILVRGKDCHELRRETVKFKPHIPLEVPDKVAERLLSCPKIAARLEWAEASETQKLDIRLKLQEFRIGELEKQLEVLKTGNHKA